ncbi:MAG TPA: phosphoglycerate kinase [Candidatus Thermoplasmatota archaeon]|jgi:phosphoglycerate kinase|nr:phosphoglycerate kinase [Candidatus Thermoplasmatota archaeon]
MADELTLDDLKVQRKTVLLRVDVNSPIQGGRVAGTERIQASAESVRALAARGAKVVVVAHQGRKGDDDYTSLREHAELLGKASGVGTRFVEDVAGPAAVEAIRATKTGEALVLENVRSLADETRKAAPEEHARAPFVQALAQHAQAYVNDAFPAAHRAQASVVGFPLLLPSAPGPAMARELAALEKASGNPEHPTVYVLGGAKPDDSIAVMQHNFASGKLDRALLTGLVGELFLVARGHELGRPTMEILEKKGTLQHLPAAEQLLEAFDEGIVTPIDVAVRGKRGREELWIEDLPAEHPILDIGRETIDDYARELQGAASIFLNGPAGVFEEPPFDLGTRAMLKAVKESEGFSLLGGGHTTSSLHKLGFRFEDFGHASLAGGALMAYLTGAPLPALEALRESARRFKGKL